MLLQQAPKFRVLRPQRRNVLCDHLYLSARNSQTIVVLAPVGGNRRTNRASGACAPNLDGSAAASSPALAIEIASLA
jgi:hypothetical protein